MTALPSRVAGPRWASLRRRTVWAIVSGLALLGQAAGAQEAWPSRPLKLPAS